MSKSVIVCCQSQLNMLDSSPCDQLLTSAPPLSHYDQPVESGCFEKEREKERGREKVREWEREEGKRVSGQRVAFVYQAEETAWQDWVSNYNRSSFSQLTGALLPPRAPVLWEPNVFITQQRTKTISLKRARKFTGFASNRTFTYTSTRALQ